MCSTIDYFRCRRLLSSSNVGNIDNSLFTFTHFAEQKSLKRKTLSRVGTICMRFHQQPSVAAAGAAIAAAWAAPGRASPL